MKQVEIYTDGACSGNPGPGGIGVVLLSGTHRKELSQGYRKTTNNRMELLAAITGLSALKNRSAVTVFSDSKYLVEAMEKGWAVGWRAKGWKKRKNPDLWRRVLDLCDQHSVKFVWVKGHADNEINNRCDELAVAAAAKPDLDPDEGYEEELLRQEAEAAQLL